MELSACCSCLYGRVHDELRYTLCVDPKEVHGDNPSTLLRAGFPGETFRVLKEKEEGCTGSIGRGGWSWLRGMGWKEDNYGSWKKIENLS